MAPMVGDMARTEEQKLSELEEDISSFEAGDGDPDDILPFIRQQVGLRMLNWHASMSDPVYVVGSLLIEGVPYPGEDEEAVEEALSNLESDLRKTKKSADRQELKAIIRWLKIELGHTPLKELTPNVAEERLPIDDNYELIVQPHLFEVLFDGWPVVEIRHSTDWDTWWASNPREPIPDHVMAFLAKESRKAAEALRKKIESNERSRELTPNPKLDSYTGKWKNKAPKVGTTFSVYGFPNDQEWLELGIALKKADLELEYVGRDPRTLKDHYVVTKRELPPLGESLVPNERTGPTEFHDALYRWLQALQQQIDRDYKGSPTGAPQVQVEQLRRYWRVYRIEYYPDGRVLTRSVLAFVDPETGDVYKPDGWKKPAKGIRGSIYDIGNLKTRSGFGGAVRNGSDYTFKPGDRNRNGLTWREWFIQTTGSSDPAVDANWSPVLTEHERLFERWQAEEPEGMMRNGRRRAPADVERHQNFAGYDFTSGSGGTTIHRKAIDTRAPGDYGADPIGDGTFRMVPSGDIVDFEERSRRLAHLYPHMRR